MSSSSEELVTLDYDRFPHFLESVIDYGDRACLLALRRVSSHCQEMVDARLFRDIILFTEITQASDTYTIVSPEGPLPLLGTLVPENGQYGQGADRHGDQEVHPLDPLRALRRHTRVVEYRPKFYKRHPTLPLRQQGAGRSVQHNGLLETWCVTLRNRLSNLTADRTRQRAQCSVQWRWRGRQRLRAATSGFTDSTRFTR